LRFGERVSDLRAVVPPKEIELAIQRKATFERDPEAHTYEEAD
jgi:hypothetical protein